MTLGVVAHLRGTHHRRHSELRKDQGQHTAVSMRLPILATKGRRLRHLGAMARTLDSAEGHVRNPT